MMLMKNNRYTINKFNNEVLFLYGKMGYRKHAKLYCELHKCYVDIYQLRDKNFKCNKCKHKKEVENGEIY